MKTYYLLNQVVWNGSRIVNQFFSIYPSRKLAEKVRDRILDLDDNEKSIFTITFQIESIDYYENESEVPILNETK